MYHHVPVDVWIHHILPFIGTAWECIRAIRNLTLVDSRSFTQLVVRVIRASLCNVNAGLQEWNALVELGDEYPSGIICKTIVKSRLRITDAQIDEIPCFAKPNPCYRRAAPMLLYDIVDVFRASMQRHGTAQGLCEYNDRLSERASKRARTAKATNPRDAFKRTEVTFCATPPQLPTEEPCTRCLKRPFAKACSHQMCGLCCSDDGCSRHNSGRRLGG
jgi:hypothetical protein